MKQKRHVFYTASHRATVEWDDVNEVEGDAVSDIDIPEGGKNDSTYLKNSMKIDGLRPFSPSVINQRARSVESSGWGRPRGWREIRIDRNKLLTILRNAGVIPRDLDGRLVASYIVWENNTTAPLFESMHGADGLLIQIPESSTECRDV